MGDKIRLSPDPFPSDLIQWLDFSRAGEFLAVMSSTSRWWIHPEQTSQIMRRENKARYYLLNLTSWGLANLHRTKLPKFFAAAVLRALQITNSGGLQIDISKEILRVFFKICEENRIPAWKILYALPKTLIGFLALKVRYKWNSAAYLRNLPRKKY